MTVKKPRPSTVYPDDIRTYLLPSEPAPLSELENVPKDWTRWSTWCGKTKTWVRYERAKS